MHAPTPRQQEILQWIRDRIEASGLPPTRAEIIVIDLRRRELMIEGIGVGVIRPGMR